MMDSEGADMARKKEQMVLTARAVAESSQMGAITVANGLLLERLSVPGVFFNNPIESVVIVKT